jgi:hypothetical protein
MKEMVKINFEDINLNDIQEVEEVVTAGLGTIYCCPNS